MRDEMQREQGPADSGTLEQRGAISRIDERYRLGERRYSTRVADAFAAEDIESGQAVTVWLLRSPLAANSEAAERFVKRLEAIQQSGANTPPLLGFGVDRANKAYAVMEVVEGILPMQVPSDDPAALEQVYLGIVGTVAALHAAGVVVGDIGEESFLVTNEGQIVIQGLLGGFEVEAAGTTMLPAPHTLHYLSPEQRVGSGLEPASDVYALGLFGYRLFSGRYPRAEKHMSLVAEDIIAMVPPPSGVRRTTAQWVDDIVGKAIEPRIEERFTDAGQLRYAIAEAINTGASPAGPSRWSRKTLMVRPSTVGVIRDTFGQQPAEQRVPGKPAAPAPSGPAVSAGRGMLVLSGGALLGVIVAGAAYLLIQPTLKGSTSDLENEIAIHDSYAPPELKRSMHDMVAPGLSMAERKVALGRIAENDDPVAYAVLISAAKGAPGPELRQAAQQFVVERIRRQGLERSAVAVARWFDTLARAQNDPSSSPGYAHLLRACDRSLPLEARRFALNKASAAEPAVALELAAALALDDPDPNSFTPVLRQLIVAEGGVRENLEGKSAAALIMGHRTLSMIFDRDVAAQLPSFGPQDLAWALLRLSETESNLIYDVAQETLDRKVVPPFQAIFLQTLVESDRLDLPGAVKRALVRGARGEIDEQDIVAFGRWLALGAEPALLAVCAIAGKTETAVSAFDTLAARSLETEPARSLVTWVKNNFWEHRDKLVKAVGILGHSKTATAQQLEYAFDVLMPFTTGGALLKVVMNSKNDDLISRALERLGEATPSEELIQLLSHDNKSVRIAAINGLRGRNELSVLQAVVRGFEKEKDPEVQEVYRQVHWVTRDRERGAH